MGANTRYTRYETDFGGIDIMQAGFLTQNFSRHTHDGYGIGTVTSGAMEFSYRGEKLVAHKGVMNSVNPDEPHDGHSYDESTGWCYSMLYFRPEVFENIYADMTDSYKLPYISSGVIDDPRIASAIAHLTDYVAGNGTDRLFAESCLLGILSSVILRHTDKRPQDSGIYRLGTALNRVKRHIEANLAGKLTVGELAGMAGVSRFHFIRSFKADTGLAPYEYASARRVSRAKELILSGTRPADAAQECGYTDQSHMNRWLKKTYGVTSSDLSTIIL